MSSLQGTEKRNSKEAITMSKFSQKYSLLSQYLQKNVTFGDKNLRIKNRQSQSPGSETGLSFLSKGENPAESSRQSTMVKIRSPKHAHFCPPSLLFNKKTDLKTPATTESGTAQMTMLYEGKILVFDDFPDDKIREIISLAGGKVSSNFTCSKSSNVGTDSGSNYGSNGTETEPHDPQLQGKDIQSDGGVPITRRVSLHRFLQKRKDRASKSPYQIGQTPAEATNPEWNQPSNEHKEFDLNF